MANKFKSEPNAEITEALLEIQQETSDVGNEPDPETCMSTNASMNSPHLA